MRCSGIKPNDDEAIWTSFLLLATTTLSWPHAVWRSLSSTARAQGTDSGDKLRCGHALHATARGLIVHIS